MSPEITNETHQPGVAPVVGIVGGHGGIGSFFARILSEAGAAVLVSDRGTALSNVEVAARSDLTLVAVPLRVTPAVLAEVAPHVRPDAGLASLGSLMEPALPAMNGCAGDTFLLHPLFGPGRRALHAAAFALTSLRGERWQGWLKRLLEDRGARIVTTTPDEHDRAMAVAQALLHGVYAALAPEIMATLPGDDPLAWATPTLRLQLALMARILRQDPALYGDLLALNRHTPLVIDRLITRLAALRAATLDGPNAVAALFKTARDDLGSSGAHLAVEGDEALGEAATPRAPATRAWLASFAEDWDAPEMDVYDTL